MKIKLTQIITYGILLLTLISINQWSLLNIGFTFFWWFVNIAILISFFKLKKTVYDPTNDKNILSIKLFLIWNIICIVRGGLVAENYWEWKNLINTAMVLLLPLSIYIATNKINVQDILRVWVRYAMPAFILFIPFLFSDAFGHYLAPIILLILWFPLLPKKWKIIVIISTLFMILAGQTARSNIIKFVMAFGLGLVFYFRVFIPTVLYRLGRLFLLMAPVLFFALAVTGVFNIFKMDEYIEGDYKSVEVIDGKRKETTAVADTRSFLYLEVIISALKHNYTIQGRTPARGNDSNSFGKHQLRELKTGKKERFANEVSILNVFTWTGLIGVLLYFFIFLKASYLAVNKSESYFMKILGLFIAFRWAYAFIEDFSRFDLFNVFLWIMIGMCFSKEFRNMNDDEIGNWVKAIFKKKEVRSTHH